MYRLVAAEALLTIRDGRLYRALSRVLLGSPPAEQDAWLSRAELTEEGMSARQLAHGWTRLP